MELSASGEYLVRLSRNYSVTQLRKFNTLRVERNLSYEMSNLFYS